MGVGAGAATEGGCGSSREPERDERERDESHFDAAGKPKVSVLSGGVCCEERCEALLIPQSAEDRQVSCSCVVSLCSLSLERARFGGRSPKERAPWIPKVRAWRAMIFGEQLM